MLRWAPLILVALSCFACAGKSDEPPQTSTTAGTKSEPKPEPESKPEARLPEVPSMEGAPAVPSVEVVAEPVECPPPPKSAGDSDLGAVVMTLHAISCHPEVFGLSTPELRTKLKISDAVQLEVGRRYARVTLPEEMPVRTVLAAMGVSQAKVRLEQGMAPRWVVGSGDDAAELRPWGPGLVGLELRADRHEDKASGTVEEIPEAAAISSVRVILPEDAANFADDPHAVAAAVGALVTLATDPGLLQENPEQAVERLPMLGERFSLHRFSIGLGDTERLGFSLRPKRTVLSAGDLATALGLQAPHHEQIHITDVNPNRLADGDRTEIPWHGLSLEIELEKADGGGLGLSGWVVEDIEILPAASAK